MRTVEDTPLGRFQIDWGIGEPTTELRGNIVPRSQEPRALTFADPLYPNETKTLNVYRNANGELLLFGEITPSVWAFGRRIADPAVTFTFGDSPELADELLALVLAGRKTATCGALRDFGDREPVPAVGRQDVVLDGQGCRAAVIETVSVELKRFDEVDADFARAEGEGDLSYGYWREAHEAYFARNGGYSPDMILVCERFQLMEVLDRNHTKRVTP